MPGPHIDDTPAWLTSLPKIELHVHLEGTIGPATLTRLFERNGLVSPSPDDLAAMFAYDDFPGFIDAFTGISDAIKTADDLGMVALDYGTQLAAQNVMYAEIHYNPEPHCRRKGIPFVEGLAAMNEARRQVRDAFGVEMRWIADGVRDANIGPASVDITIDWIIEAGPEAGIVALGLGGNEILHPARNFRRSFERARAEGINVVAHAGEAVGPESIWETIRELGVARIGHGITAGQDDHLMDYLAEHQIPLEISPSSNIRTGVIASLEDLPFHQFVERGVPFSINSDDPPLFGTTLTNEYHLVSQHLNWSPQDLLRQIGRTIDQSFAEPPLKRQMHERLAAWAKQIKASEPAALRPQ